MRRAVNRFAMGVVSATLLVSGCSGESRREASEPQAKTGGGASVDPGTAAAKPVPTGSVPAVSAAPGQWVRVPVSDAKVETKDGKQVLTVKAKTPGSGWKLEVRPLPGNDPSVKELEVVGTPADARTGGSLEEQIVAYPMNLGDKPNQPVLVHGAGAAIFAQ
jgi:hypothetical protein